MWILSSLWWTWNCKKIIYFTRIQTAGQDAKNVLALADNILKKLQADFPHINKAYTKPDNASCYHKSLGPEALYRLCKNFGIDLCRHDFNEPCKGKDQCEWENNSTKTIPRSYLQAENDILTADDIAKGMCYDFGVQLRLAVKDQTKTSLTGKKIKNFTSYHSFEFKVTEIMAWRYFGIGEGVFILNVRTSFWQAGFEVTKTFTKTDQKKQIHV